MKPWVKIGLFTSVWLFAWMTFIAPYIFVWTGLQDEDEPKFSTGKIIINVIGYTITGLIIGYINRNNKKASIKH